MTLVEIYDLPVPPFNTSSFVHNAMFQLRYMRHVSDTRCHRIQNLVKKVQEILIKQSFFMWYHVSHFTTVRFFLKKHKDI